MSEAAAPPAVTVDIWSDVACPWCYIGRSRFEQGVRQFGEQRGAAPVVIEYRSFELVPDAPVEFDGDELAFLSGRYGVTREDARRMVDRVAATAAAAGLPYDPTSVRHTNTRKAHELLHFARARGVQAAMKERLMHAYFAEGRHLGLPGELADLAGEVGLPPGEAAAALADGRHAPDVEADVAQAAALGITGVPFYVVDGRFGVSGAREPELFAAVLARAAGEASETLS